MGRIWMAVKVRIGLKARTPKRLWPKPLFHLPVTSTENQVEASNGDSGNSIGEMPDIVRPAPLKRRRKVRKFERGDIRDDYRYYITCTKGGEVRSIAADATTIKRHFKSLRHAGMTATEQKTYIVVAMQRLKEAQNKTRSWQQM